ncbi:uncharacterized protein LOC126260574 [Schistocerca nitens]|uniref:uncharacterized protein LOC126260574 n=1 Tax=Schistocerca nitens TaxID=7011 RepID=UPI0021183524|nr:uncharacterized protein LOC126260574 [Schistocerca nitens]
MLSLSEQRRSLAEQLEEAGGERARLQLALSAGGWRRGLFCAPLAGLGPSAEEASRRILHHCGRNKQLARDLREAERRLERAECGLLRVQENLALASRRVDQKRSDARQVARLAAELRAAAADTDAALAEARRKRRALSKRLRHTNRAVERALVPDEHLVSAFQPPTPGHASAYKALQLRVKLLDLEQQLEKQHREGGRLPCSIQDIPRHEEAQVGSLLQLQDDLQQQQLLADAKARACQEAQLRVQHLHLQMAQIAAAARERLDSRLPLMEGLEAAWQGERREHAARLQQMAEHEEACAVAEGVLDTALSHSASTARAVSDELQRYESQVSALSSVAETLLAARQWKNLWLRLREAEARSRQIHTNLQADRRLAAALDARLHLCQQHKASSSISLGGEATTVRAEFLEAEARDVRVSVAQAAEDTARLEVVCARETERVRLLYEHAIGIPLCDPDAQGSAAAAAAAAAAAFGEGRISL